MRGHAADQRVRSGRACRKRDCCGRFDWHSALYTRCGGTGKCRRCRRRRGLRRREGQDDEAVRESAHVAKVHQDLPTAGNGDDHRPLSIPGVIVSASHWRLARQVYLDRMPAAWAGVQGSTATAAANRPSTPMRPAPCIMMRNCSTRCDTPHLQSKLHDTVCSIVRAYCFY